MQKILIVGPGGAGKSTLARRLGTLLELPVIHLDAQFWQPGWEPTPDEQWEAKVRELLAGERWIIDGNYGGTRQLRFAAADTIIFLDFPIWLCLARVLWRILRYRGNSRPDMAADCPERFDLTFLRWIWTFPRRSRPAIYRDMAAATHARAIVLHGPADVQTFLRQRAPAREAEGLLP